MPNNCVELIIYDDDGPEGFFKRSFFNRSSQAIEAAMAYFPLSDYNFEIRNHYKIKVVPCANQIEGIEMG